MNGGKVDPTQKRAPMHSSDAEVELFTVRTLSGSVIDDLDEEELDGLLEVLEKSFGTGERSRKPIE